MSILGRHSLFIVQATIAVVATTLVLLFVGRHYAGIFGYGCLMVISGQFCVWWVCWRTDSHKKQGIIISDAVELARMKWALFIKFMVIALYFVFAWRSDYLLSNPIALIFGYLAVSLGAVPISHFLEKEKEIPRKNNENKDD